MYNDVSVHDLVELFVASPTSPRSSKTESGCKRYARFRIAISAVFLWGGSSGPEAGNSGPRKFRPVPRNIRPYFSFRGFWLSLFRVSLWRGSGNLLRKFPRKFPGVRKFRSLVRNIRPKENLAKSFAFFSRVGVRNFAPEVFSGNFRGTGSSGVSPGISGPRPEVPALKPGISGPALLQRLVFGRRL